MKLPNSVDDPSLCHDEALSDYIAMAKEVNSRSEEKRVIAAFVSAARGNPEIVAAARRWAYLLFQDILTSEHALEATDGGEKLYEAFFQYQRRLHRGLRTGNMKEADKYLAHVVRNGLAALGLTYQRVVAVPQRVRRKDRKRRKRQDSGQLKTLQAAQFCGVASAVESTGAGDIQMIEGDTRPKLGNLDIPVIRPETDGNPGVLWKDGKHVKHPGSGKNNKRKTSSQEPSVISPPDVSEDDASPPGVPFPPLEDASTSHPSKLVTSESPRLFDLPEAENQSKANDFAHPSGRDKQSCEDTGMRELKYFDSVVTSRTLRGRRVALPARAPAGPRREIKRSSIVVTRKTRTGSRNRGPRQPILGTKVLQFRATKRIRQGSVSTFSADLRGYQEGPELIPDIHRSASTQSCNTIRSPFTIANAERARKLRRKRTRVEFEAEFAIFNADVSDDTRHEPVGIDAREIRPLPQKLCTERSLRAVNAYMTSLEITNKAQSLEDAGRLLRDSATNALAVLQATEVGPDEPDWAEVNELDVDCDGLGGTDQDEDNDAPITAPGLSLSDVKSKPPVPAPPHIWAQTRQEVCESFEHFRSYHGGVYSKNDIVKGYLLGAFSASRDIFHHGGRLIISHGGGKSESTCDARMGPRKYIMDQDQEATDRSVRALLKTHKEKRALTLLADDKYALFPYDLAGSNYTYVVLGLYWVSHAWAECQPTRDGSRRVVRWKFAFQWCEGQGDPWWIPRHAIEEAIDYPLHHKSDSDTRSSLTTDPSRSLETSSHVCEECQAESPIVYRQGWMCLNPRCKVFWSINGDDPQELDYAEGFLQLAIHRFRNLPDIRPTKGIETSDGVTTTYLCSKGWHCTNCGRLSCRYKWERWECSNCQAQRAVKGRLRSPKEFWHQRPSRAFLHSLVDKDSGIIACRLEPVDLGSPKGFTNRLSFIFPHGRGKIHLILGTPLANGDADDIFRMYQEQASTGELKLRRYPLRNHRARGALLTNYFSQNSGEPYQYVGGTGNTVPFHEAPDCVRRSLALIKERAGLALHTDIPFNEVLSAAYMERQKMSFHSDSEKGLGPSIASLSLGSAALMHFRLHANVDDVERSRSYALTLVLRHGDVLIMEGDGVQKYYEHTVIPMNFRIAATARCIGST